MKSFAVRFCGLLCCLLVGACTSSSGSATVTVDTTVATMDATSTSTLVSTSIATQTPEPSPTATKTPTSTPTPSPTDTPMPGNWNRYQPRTLKDIIDQVQDEFVLPYDENVLYVEARDDYASLVQVIYTGQFRTISEGRLKLIQLWLGNKVPYLTREEAVSLVQTEGLFREGPLEYWLPIQSQLIPFMGDELQKGDEMTLFVVWIGAEKKARDTKIEWVFLVNEFLSD